MEGRPKGEGATGTSYRRLCGIAAGGMGFVELAVREEGRFRRLYAVKRLRELYRENAEFAEMFVEEGRLAGLIRHPNVVSVLDVGEDADGPFLVMDYIEGTSVAQIIKRISEFGQQVPIQVALRIVMETALGLHAAHELRDGQGQPMSLVHRDVSPQNLLVGFDGLARVTDFGIAKAHGRTTRTATGVLKGKFGYLAPEQLRFEEPDRRSDLFSLGVVLYELLAGRRLYRNENGMDGARRILTEPPPDLGEERDDVPAELIELSFSMLAKDREHRPPDAMTVARTLEAVLAELVALDGRVEVADFVVEAFADERGAREAEIATALAATEAGSSPHYGSEEPTLTEASPAALALDASGLGQPRPRAVPLVAVAVAGVFGVAAAVGAILAFGGAGATGDPPVPAPPVVSQVPTNQSPGDAAGLDDASVGPVVVTGEAPGANAQGGQGGQADGADRAATAGPRATAMTNRRRRPRRPARGMSSMGGGVPMWDWQ